MANGVRVRVYLSECEWEGESMRVSLVSVIFFSAPVLFGFVIGILY